jgi:glutathione synthase/RimK-type ligase-like ATP-grasp enzyme/ribosomal protein S18 acetylase RimI-like enzyme
MIQIRAALLSDIGFLLELESSSFRPSRKANEVSIKNSILSKHQMVMIIEKDSFPIGSATIFKHANSYRVYSIAIHPSNRGFAYGKKLMDYIINMAKSEKKQIISLEADATDIHLMKFYESFGFKVKKELHDYYGEGEPAYRMQLILDNETFLRRRKLSNIVVVDQEISWLKKISNIHLISAESYISDEKYQRAKGVRIFNLCSSYEYQSLGYYVSLLAQARLQRVIPNVATIKDFQEAEIIETIGDEANHLIQKSLKHLNSSTFTIQSYFGLTPIKKYDKLIKALYQLFEAPFLEFYFEKTIEWNLKKVTPIPFSMIDTELNLEVYAEHYFNQKRFSISRFKDYPYDLAILIDPEEKMPPSDKIALSKFKVAAEKIGFYTEFITKDDYHRISEFDALFIRTTTNVNDYTYQFSRYAYAEGLAVIDDPWSILKCSNKLFFAESMKKVGVLVPKTIFISKKTSDLDITKVLDYPIILKQPDSAFSLGVFKVRTKEELDEKLFQLLQYSELVVAQEFIKSDFDWRIGIIDHKPIFACKYHMAKNHWQIINWQSKKVKDKEGTVEAFKIEDVPQNVIDTATKAAMAIGDGFYGVDLKESQGKIYVIEVNDNPNVDYRKEDQILRDDLYKKIIKTLFYRIENARNIKRKVS